MAYIGAIIAHPAYVNRFREDLAQPGLRIPVTASAETFRAGVEIGRTVIWLHTFGERFSDVASGRPSQSPRMSGPLIPRVPAGGEFQPAGDPMPDEISYDVGTQTLHLGNGRIENVSNAIWEYEVSGKQVLRQWFSYRKANRERPVMGDRRPPSRLGEIQPDRWPAEYTTELLNLIHVLGRLVELEPRQAELLELVCSGPTISAVDLVPPIEPALQRTGKGSRTRQDTNQHELLDPS